MKEKISAALDLYTYCRDGGLVLYGEKVEKQVTNCPSIAQFLNEVAGI